MKLTSVMSISVFAFALGLGTSVLQAQETNQIEQLKRQLQQVQENFERAEREHREQVEALSKKLDALARQQSAGVTAAVVAAEPYAESTPKAWRPSDPVRVGRGSAYMDIGLVGTFAVGGSTAEEDHLLPQRPRC